jgi:hypothetical protein
VRLPTIWVLRDVWKTQSIEEDRQLRWRILKAMPAAADEISSPYDQEARYSTKRNIWVQGCRATNRPSH